MSADQFGSPLRAVQPRRVLAASSQHGPQVPASSRPPSKGLLSHTCSQEHEQGANGAGNAPGDARPCKRWRAAPVPGPHTPPTVRSMCTSQTVCYTRGEQPCLKPAPGWHHASGCQQTCSCFTLPPVPHAHLLPRHVRGSATAKRTIEENGSSNRALSKRKTVKGSIGA